MPNIPNITGEQRQKLKQKNLEKKKTPRLRLPRFGCNRRKQLCSIIIELLKRGTTTKLIW